MTPVYHYHTAEAFKNYIDIMMQAYREAVRLKEAVDRDMAEHR
jgi:NAD(P)H-dependent FMN reductase